MGKLLEQTINVLLGTFQIFAQILIILILFYLLFYGTNHLYHYLKMRKLRKMGYRFND